MMKFATIILLLMNTHLGSIAQEISDFYPLKERIVDLGKVIEDNEDFGADYEQLSSLLKNVEIVMLGEQSHGEGTVFQTKIKLIKYLHQKLDFDLLVFESGIYDCHKAAELIGKGENARDVIGNSVFYIWSQMKEFKPLVEYLESSNSHGKKMTIAGFDCQFTGKLSEEFFIQDLSQYFNSIDSSIIQSKDWEHLVTNLKFLHQFENKQLKKNNPELDTIYIEQLINRVERSEIDSNSSFWIQILKSLKSHLSDRAMGSDKRDKQMAENLIWIKENYPDKKIICWGATSHFLYNSTEIRMSNPIVQLLAGKDYKKDLMMGNFIKAKYGSKVFTIGFTAYQGEYFGTFGVTKLRLPKKNSLEFVLGQSEYDNFLLPLKGLSVNGFKSRPLGNFYMKNDITNVMDAVIFNRTIAPPHLDRNFFLKLNPENKYVKPEVEVE